MPRVPPEGWCTMIRELGSAMRMPGSPAASRKLPIEAAWPMQTVDTFGRIYCMVSWIAMPAVITPPGGVMDIEMFLGGVFGLENKRGGENNEGNLFSTLPGTKSGVLRR